jgi:hypothetical protein
MPKAKTSRKQLFRAALAIAGLSAGEWAEQQGITPQWLSMVLNSKADSITLNKKIDAFVKEWIGRNTAALAS